MGFEKHHLLSNQPGDPVEKAFRSFRGAGDSEFNLSPTSSAVKYVQRISKRGILGTPRVLIVIFYKTRALELLA